MSATASYSVILVFVLVSGVEWCATKELSIAAFNVRIFGQTKAKDEFVMGILTKIILRYDVILIQEIRDSKETAIEKLLEQVNAVSQSNPFSMEVSERLGRTSSKEQYAFLYRQNSGLRVENSYIYDDGDESLNNKTAQLIVDTFEREPFILLFSSTSTVLREFALGGIHIAPENAVEEIKALKEVFVDVQQKFGVRDIMMMGDLNADCSYVPNYKWSNIALKADPNYHWLISDSVDTTVSNTNCAYDRFIGKGLGFSADYNGGVVADSAKVFDYMKEYGLTLEQALKVSDHFPIEFKLKDRDITEASRLRTAKIFNVYVAVPGRSLSQEKTYYITNQHLTVKTADGVIVGALTDVTPKDKDICRAVRTILDSGLYENKVKVKMIRSRKWRGKQLCNVIIELSNAEYLTVKHVLDRTLKKYGNVAF